MGRFTHPPSLNPKSKSAEPRLLAEKSVASTFGPMSKAPPPTGLTIVTPSYRHLEKPAVQSFQDATGLPVKVIRTSDKRGFTAKLELDRHAKGRAIFFDIDTRFVKPLDLARWNGDFLAVHDPAVFIPGAFPCDDCERHRLDKNAYFNSGFMAMDFGKREHRRLFQTARRIHQRVERGTLPPPIDKTDQYYLNAAAQRDGLHMNYLPFGFNMYTYCVKHGGREAYPRDVTMVHAAGYPLRKKRKALEAMSLIFGGDCTLMQPAAITHLHAITHELR